MKNVLFFKVTALITLLCCAMLCIPCAAATVYQDVSGGQIRFDTQTGMVVGFVDVPDNIVIPQQIDGVTVTAIAARAFAQCTSLVSVQLPNTVTIIGNGAFYNCANLISVQLPTALEIIEANLFYGCVQLQSIAMPASVETVRDYAFADCFALQTVTFSQNLTNIGSYAFLDCMQLQDISFPQNLQKISNDAFSGCVKLTTVTIPQNVTHVGRNAFAGCNKLENILVDTSNAAYTSDGGVLFSKYMDTLLQYPAGKAGQYMVPVGTGVVEEQAFGNCTKLSEVTIPGSVYQIGAKAFGGCVNLILATFESPTMPYMGGGVFSYCGQVVLQGESGSQVEQYAQTNGLPFRSTTDFGDFDWRINKVTMAAGQVNATLQKQNNPAMPSIVVALYNRDGRLLDTKTATVTGGKLDYQISADLTNVATVKVMLWSSLDKMQPVAKPYTYLY